MRIYFFLNILDATFVRSMTPNILFYENDMLINCYTCNFSFVFVEASSLEDDWFVDSERAGGGAGSLCAVWKCPVA